MAGLTDKVQERLQAVRNATTISSSKQNRIERAIALSDMYCSVTPDVYVLPATVTTLHAARIDQIISTKVLTI